MLGRLLPAWLAASLGLSVYWIFAVMILDYCIKAALLVVRFRSGNWLDIRISPAKSGNLATSIDSDKKNT